MVCKNSDNWEALFYDAKVFLAGMFISYFIPQLVNAHTQAVDKRTKEIFASAFDDSKICSSFTQVKSPYEGFCEIIKHAKQAACDDLIDDSIQHQCLALENLISGNPSNIKPSQNIQLIHR